MHFASRVAFFAGLLALLLGGSGFLALRYWILPNADHMRAFVAEDVERRIGRRVVVGGMEINWAGLRPDLTLTDVHVFDSRGFPALTLDSVHAVLSWRSLAVLEPRVHVLILDGPHLNLKRGVRGNLYIAGIATSPIAMDLTDDGLGDPHPVKERAAVTDEAPEPPQDTPSRLLEWLFVQRQVVVTDARITWEDEQRGAPSLTLERVELRLENSGTRHRAALRGAAPPEQGGSLDLRADFRARGIADWRRVTGELYLAAGAVALEAWRPWIDLPLELHRGRGAVRAWLTLTEGRLTASTVDANLAGVSARLAPALPPLDVTAVKGRVRWRGGAEGWEIGTRGLELLTGDGIRIGPADLSLERRAGAGERPPAVAFSANRVDLGAFASLASHLPLNEETRVRVAALAPGGTLADVVAAWEGELPGPRTYRVRARFDGLELKPYDAAPGLSGVSGEVDGNERHGRFGIDGTRAALELPKVFALPLKFDTLTIRGTWTRAGAGTEVTLQKATFANADVAGAVTGTYQTVPAGPGEINLIGSLTRADVRGAYRYMPLEVNEDAREWVRTSLLSGRGVDTRFTLKGDLARFPFRDRRDGVFEVSTRAVGVDLSFADDWPTIRGVAGEVLFRGAGMRISGATGAILGVPIAGVSAVIPDLDADEPVLEVKGHAQGETDAFLRFVDRSPVDAHIDGFTRPISASGAGRLDLELTVPLEHGRDTRASGRFQFLNNRLSMHPDVPALEDLSGVLAFTQDDVKTDGLKGRMMGGPLELTARTRDGALRLEAAGRIDTEAWKLRQDFPWARHVSGAADWKYTQTARRDRIEDTLQSSLRGLALSYPAPVGKTAATELPLDVERVRAGGRETLSLRLGNLLSVQAAGRTDGNGQVLENAAMVFGGGTAQATRPGLWVSGSAQMLDLDAWREVLRGESGKSDLALQGLDLGAARLFAFNRLFRDVRVRGQQTDGVFRAAVEGRELAGDVAWAAEGEGALQARLTRLVIPSDETLGRSAEVAGPQTRSLPGLDIVADSFSLGERPMGRLELKARNEGGLWRVSRLELRHPDSVISADGEWSGATSPPASRFNVALEAIDLGRFVARIGVGEGMRGGTGSVNGRIEWAGSPYRVDYPTLGGALKLAFKDGRFDEVDPGMAKLLGVLSLSALPRRLGGDFNDVFGKGFVFQEITGDVTLARGVARTENLAILSPSVRVAMRGEVNLARETQSLRLRVTPELSETAALATGVVGGPVVGLATLAVVKLFRDPIGQLAALEYNVSGSWSDPQVTRLSRTPAQEQQ